MSQVSFVLMRRERKLLITSAKYGYKYKSHIVGNVCAQSSCVQLYSGPGSLASSAATDSGEGGGAVEDGSCRDQTQMWTLWLVSMSAMPGKL